MQLFVTEHSNGSSILLKIEVVQYLFFNLLPFHLEISVFCHSLWFLRLIPTLVSSSVPSCVPALSVPLLHHELCPLQTSIFLLSMEPSFQFNHAQVSCSFTQLFKPQIQESLWFLSWFKTHYLIHQQVLLYPPQKQNPNLINSPHLLLLRLQSKPALSTLLWIRTKSINWSSAFPCIPSPINILSTQQSRYCF